MTTTQAIPVVVNGQHVEVPAGGNVLSLLEFLKIAPDRVAIELNTSLVRKRDWKTTNIFSGAQVEVVEFVGGG